MTPPGALQAERERLDPYVQRLHTIVVNDGRTWGSNPHFEHDLEAAVDLLGITLLRARLAAGRRGLDEKVRRTKRGDHIMRTTAGE